jgi:hypothetical protein
MAVILRWNGLRPLASREQESKQMKTGICSLGTRKDATTWEKGCQKLGFDVPLPIKKPSPTMQELKTFCKSSPDWIFFAGHYGGLTMTNERDTVEIRFGADHVKLTAGDESASVKKGTPDFELDKNCKVILWGGCNVCTSKYVIRTLRTLFGAHVMLGFAGLTGWRMVDAMLGGGFIKIHFFTRVKDCFTNPAKIRDAWMQTARDGYAKSDFEDRFRAIDPAGQEWLLNKGRITRGRRIR